MTFKIATRLKQCPFKKPGNGLRDLAQWKGTCLVNSRSWYQSSDWGDEGGLKIHK